MDQKQEQAMIAALAEYALTQAHWPTVRAWLIKRAAVDDPQPALISLRAKALSQ